MVQVEAPMKTTTFLQGKAMQAIEMNAQVTENHEINLKLPGNIKHGTVKVIVMYDEMKNASPTVKNRQFGQFKGQIKINDDFDNALPDSFWTGENR